MLFSVFNFGLALTAPNLKVEVLDICKINTRFFTVLFVPKITKCMDQPLQAPTTMLNMANLFFSIRDRSVRGPRESLDAGGVGWRGTLA